MSVTAPLYGELMDTKHMFDSDRELLPMEDELAALAGVRNAADGRLVQFTARVLVEESWKGAGLHTPIHWLMWQAGIARGTARRILTIALRAAELPTVMELLVNGRLSLDQAHAVARYTPAEYEESVCNLALYATVSQIIAATRTYGFDLERPDPDKSRRRGISFGHADDGTWWAKVRLAAEEGAIVEEALRRTRRHLHFEARDAAKRAARAEGRPDTGNDAELRVEPTSWADAFLAMAMDGLNYRGAGGDDDPATATDPGDPTDPGDSADSGDPTVAASSAGSSCSSGSSRYPTIRPKLHLHLEKPTGEHATGAWVSEMHGGLALPDWLRRQLSCDSDISVVWNRDGTPLSTCASVRTPPERLRRLVEHRDHYTCRTPGCDNRRWLQLHHIIHWEDGGHTVTSNLAALCPDHHRAHHRGLLGITGNADAPAGSDDALRFTNEYGCEIHETGSVTLPTLEDLPRVAPYDHPLGERLDRDAVHFNMGPLITEPAAVPVG